MEAYFKDKLIMQQRTGAYSPEYNGIAESYNQTLSVMVHPAHEHAPHLLWAEAFNWACDITNRLPYSALDGITPCDGLYNVKPSISPRGHSYTKCDAHICEAKCRSGSKLKPRSVEGRMIGYSNTGKMFCIFFPRKHVVDSV